MVKALSPGTPAKTKMENVKEEMLVLIREDNTSVLQWPMGRIIKAIPGKDGYVRVAELKTARGIFKRDI